MTIFGLGNPGVVYCSTRHSVGYIFLDKMARLYKRRFVTQKGYKIAKTKISNERMNLIKPLCWMNQSGRTIVRILQEIEEDFLVILDDFNLPLGKIRLKSRGSDGGHLGLRSIIDSLGSSAFPRLRIGIGSSNNDVVSFVLAPFKRNEKKILMSVIKEGIRGVEIMVTQGFAKAQNYINSVNLLDSDR